MCQGLKWVIRELKLNTGQNFWKNHVSREDFLKVNVDKKKSKSAAVSVSDRFYHRLLVRCFHALRELLWDTFLCRNTS